MLSKALSSKQISILDTSMAAVLPRMDLSKLSGKRLFITGGTGFFGLWLLTALSALNNQKLDIKVCVLSRNPSNFLARYTQFRDHLWLDFITGDVKEFQIPDRNFDLLIHAATETSLAAHSAPSKMFDDIVLGTRRVLQLVRQCGIGRMLLISSGAVYGPQPINVSHQPESSLLACDPALPPSAYGEGKRVMELLGAMLQHEAGIESVAARCYAFCGPGLPLDGHFAVGNFVRDALFGEQIIVNGDGSPMRSYLHGADLAVWLLYLLLHGKAGDTYNVGSDHALSIKDLAFQVRDVLAPRKNVKVLADEDNQISGRRYYVPSIDRARKLGCQPWTTLEEALCLTGKYHQL